MVTWYWSANTLQLQGCSISKKYTENQGSTSLLNYYLKYGHHVARLRHNRRAYAPTKNTASHNNHEKINSWFSFLFVYEYGAIVWGSAWGPIWPPELRYEHLHNSELMSPSGMFQGNENRELCNNTAAMPSCHVVNIFLITILYAGNRDTHEFFVDFKVTFLMPRVCCKPITWYIEMHHVKELLHKLYMSSNPFMSVVQHLFNHVTIPHFALWLKSPSELNKTNHKLVISTHCRSISFKKATDLRHYPIFILRTSCLLISIKGRWVEYNLLIYISGLCWLLS